MCRAVCQSKNSEVQIPFLRKDITTNADLNLLSHKAFGVCFYCRLECCTCSKWPLSNRLKVSIWSDPCMFYQIIKLFFEPFVVIKSKIIYHQFFMQLSSTFRSHCKAPAVPTCLSPIQTAAFSWLTWLASNSNKIFCMIFCVMFDI